MTNYALADYGPNPNAGVAVNADNGWGPYKWPEGVPDELMGEARYTFGTLDPELGTIVTAKVRLRKELIPLWLVSMEISDALGYIWYGYPNPGENDPTWGPFSYENRPIGGTDRASNHSRARAWDGNAPRNPQSRNFISDIPPKLEAILESIGWCWGGRYVGSKYDPMHHEYGYRPEDVAGHIAKAKAILARLRGTAAPEGPTTTPTAPTPEPNEGDLTVAQIDELLKAQNRTNDLLERLVDASEKELPNLRDIRTFTEATRVAFVKIGTGESVLKARIVP